ncbi:UDP-4-amino-4,6-dideoxy-N-acetyl-beta-L-altrosamine transaminase [Viridibacterium curvum]|uniref:UDP-4-amino-4, 6-dideoxy-N-acetyl-beta-L-altrosami ne transaminase n=1 Tax=Viridibacterium curvum TaxID=1101404 RepID=A0ABP9QAD6_9RHOO
MSETAYMASIPYSRQCIEDDDVAAVAAALRGDWLTQGPTIGQFEQAVARWCGAAHATAVSNATAGLHIACMALGLERGKRLWTSPITFVASANCGRYCGASVDFVDIDPRTYCISMEALAAKLEQAEAMGKLPDVLVAVDFAGQPCDWKRLGELKQRYGFRLIHDAAHSFGAEYFGKRVGGLGIADCTVFSFHPVKILTTGEGGMVLTDDPALHEAFGLLRSHGITRQPEALQRQDEGGWYYEQQTLGFNYRMTDLAAALGISQLGKVERFIARRRELAARYDDLLADVLVERPFQSPNGKSAYHLYPVLLADSETRHRTFDALREQGIHVQVHYIPVHLQPDYMRSGFRRGDFPIAEAYYERTLSIPLFPTMTLAEQDVVVASLRRILQEQ